MSSHIKCCTGWCQSEKDNFSCLVKLALLNACVGHVCEASLRRQMLALLLASLATCGCPALYLLQSPGACLKDSATIAGRPWSCCIYRPAAGRSWCFLASETSPRSSLHQRCIKCRAYYKLWKEGWHLGASCMNVQLHCTQADDMPQ